MKVFFRLLWLAPVLAALVLLPASCSQWIIPDPVPPDPLTMSPEEVVESFYNWYIEYLGNALSDRAYRHSPFLTSQFVLTVDKVVDSVEKGDQGAGRNGGLGGGRSSDFDPFLCGQELPERVTAQPAEIDKNTASVRVDTSLSGHFFTIQLKFIDHEWLINEVDCLSGSGAK